MNNKLLYEKYHKNNSIQKKIINDKNFTYRNICLVLNRYINKKSRILDIGCGAGSISLYLAAKGHNVKGIDISKKAIEVAKKSSIETLSKNIPEFKMSDISNYVKSKHEFDIVLAIEVLEHLKDDKKIIRKITRILKKDGMIIASSPMTSAPLYRLGLLRGFDKRVGHLRRYNKKDFVKLFSRNGFKIIALVKTEGILRNFLFTNDFAGRLLKFVRGPVSDFVTAVDNFSIKIFGASDILVVAIKK